MSQIDIKNSTIRLCDGRRASLTPVSAPANSRLTFTDKSYHRGSLWQTVDPITVAIVVAGNNTALSVAVVGKAITIHQSTDGGGAATGTGAQIKAAVEASSPAHALVDVSHFSGSTGAGITAAAASAPLANGPRALVMKIGDGNLTWDEMSNLLYMKDRGNLDGVRNADEEPMPVKMAYSWEFLQAVVSSGTPTAEDVLLQRGEAAAWVSTSPDTCEPYCIDIELEYDAPCTPARKEFILFPMFRWEDLDHDPKAANIDVSGKCNALEPIITEA